jgi:hypothetical protein
MGFFSWNCKACGHSVISRYASNEVNEWMTEAVILTSDGELCRGEYDGYGCAGSWDYNDFGGEPEMYHKACWEAVGKPTEFTGASESSRDQGYFFNDNAHNFYAPRNEQDLHNIRMGGIMAEKQSCDTWKIAHLEYMLNKVHEVVMSGKAVTGEELTQIREEIERHIENRKREENQEEADRLGLSYDEFMEFEEHIRGLLPEDANEFVMARPTQKYEKVEKLENGHFRITSSNEFVFDRDFENDKIYMVNDPCGEIAPGTEQSEWFDWAKEEI